MKRLISLLSMLLTVMVATGSLYALAPTTQARYLAFSNVAGTSMKLSWINGTGGNGRIVVAYDLNNGFADWADVYTALNSTNTAFTDVAGNYAAETIQTIGANALANYKVVDVMNDGARTTNITGLMSGHTYSFHVFEFNKVEDIYTYRNEAGTLNPRSKTMPPTVVVASINLGYATNLNSTQFLANWTTTGYNLGENGYYEFIVATDANFTSNVENIDVGTATYFIYEGSTTNTTYYYKVRPCINGVAYSWSDPKSVTTFGSDPTISSTHVSCNGGSNGAADLSITDGQTPLSYNWTATNPVVITGSSTSQDLTGLKAGTYSVTITDAGNNTSTPVEVTITEPNVLAVTATSVNCNYGGKGSIDLSVSGGTTSYTIAWTGPNNYTSSNEDLTGLDAGTYSVSVTDAKGCTAGTSVTIEYLPVRNTTNSPYTYYATIQGAIDAVATENGDVIDVAAGTYTLPVGEPLVIDKAVTIIGAVDGSNVPTSTINIAALLKTAEAPAGILPSVNGITFENFNVIGNNSTTDNTPYAIHNLLGISGLTIENVNVSGVRRTAFDFNDLHNSTIKNVKATGVTDGFGFAISNTSNTVTIDGLTTATCAWGDVGVMSWTDNSANFPSGIEFKNLTLGYGFIALQPDTYVPESTSRLISTVDDQDILYNASANVKVPAEYNHVVYNKRDNDIREITYSVLAGEANAITYAKALVASAVPTYTYSDVTIRNLETGAWTVAPAMKIQDAVNQAAATNTINVKAGTYTEKVNVNKALTLTGAANNASIIDGANTGVVVTISANDVILDGFKIQNGGYTDPNTEGGVLISNGTTTAISGVKVENCIINHNATGIAVVRGTTNTIKNNTITNNLYGVGIAKIDETTPSTSNTVQGNTITGGAVGVYVDKYCANNIITTNTINTYTQNGIYLWATQGNSVTDNIITGNSSIIADSKGIQLAWGSGNTITGNTISGNALGIELRKRIYTSNTIEHNKIMDNTDGAKFHDFEVVNPAETAVLTDNYWGTLTGPSHATNPCGTGNSVSDNVTYSPWFTDVNLTDANKNSTITGVDITQISNITTIAKTPVIVPITVTYPATITAPDAVLTDAKIVSGKALPSTAKVESVTYQDGDGTIFTIKNQNGSGYSLDGKTSVYLSDILTGLGETNVSTKLNGHAGKELHWTITLSGFDASATYALTVTPESYITKADKCHSEIGTPKAFTIEFLAVPTSTFTSTRSACNKAELAYSITYEQMAVDARVTNDAHLTVNPALPDGATISWTYEGVAAQPGIAPYVVPSGTTELDLSTITTVANVPMQNHNGTIDWVFTITGLDDATDYTFTIENQAKIGTNRYPYITGTTTKVEGLPATADITLTTIDDITTIAKTPIIITSGTTYPAMTGIAENVLVDEKITTSYSGGFPAGMKVTKVVYKNVTTSNTIETTTNYSVAGKSVVYLSDILGGTAAPLMSESGENITFDLYVEGATAATTAIPVTVQTVVYNAKTEDVAPTCETEIGSAETFNVTFLAAPTSTFTSTRSACNKAELAYSITYSPMVVDDAVTNDAHLTVNPALPAGATISWTYEGVAAQPGIAPYVVPSGTTELDLSTITTVADVPMQNHLGKIDWVFTITGLDDATDYTFTIDNEAKIGTNRYPYITGTTTTIEGLPTTNAFTLTAIDDITTIAKTPIIISSGTTYPTMTGIAENVLVDEKITTSYSGGFPAGMKVTKVVYKNVTTSNTIETTTNYSVAGKSVVYLSDILGGTAAPLMSESGENITFDLYVEGATAATTAIPVTVQTVVYNAKTEDVAPTCETAIGSAETFNVTYKELVLAQLIPTTAQTTNNTATLNFNITYPEISTDLNTAITNDAVIHVTPALPADTKLNWTYEGVSGTEYTLNTTAPDNFGSGENTYTEIYLSKITSIDNVAMAAHNGRADNWIFTLSSPTLSAKDYTVTVNNVAQIDGQLDRIYNTEIATINGLATVTLSAIDPIKTITKTPVIITEVVTYPTTISAGSTVLTDAIISLPNTDVFPTGAVIKSVTYKQKDKTTNVESNVATFNVNKSLANVNSIYLSEILGSAATPLNGHANLITTWTFTVEGFADPFDKTVTFTPVAYTTKGSDNIIGNVEDFNLTFADPTIAVTPTTAQIMCNATTIDFDITYPAIENVNTNITNDAVLTLTPAIPVDAVIDWTFGVDGGATQSGTQYKVKTEDNTTGNTVIRLSDITNPQGTDNQLVLHNGKTHNWHFAISGNGTTIVDINKDYALDISNVAVLNGTDYQYNNSDVAIKGLPTTTSNIDIANVSTIAATPVVIYENINFGTKPEGYAANVLTDALIETNLGFSENSKVISVKANGHEFLTAPYSLEKDATKVLLSTIISPLQAGTLNGQGPDIDWEITVVSPTAYSATVGLTPVVYTTKPDFTPTSACYTAIGSKDEFKLEFNTIAESAATLTPNPAQIINNQVTLNFEITYPTIAGVVADVKNNAIIKVTPALPEGTNVAWTYETAPTGSYTVVAADDNHATGSDNYSKIYLSKLMNSSNPVAGNLQGHIGTNHWTFKLSHATANLAANDYVVDISNVAQLGTADYTYNTETARIVGLPSVTMNNDIASISTITKTPVIITKSITFPATITATDEVLTDALISSTTAFPVGTKVTSVKFNNQEALATTYSVTGAAKSSLYLSEILGTTATKLNGHKGVTNVWDITISGFDTPYTGEVSMIPVAYTLGTADAKENVTNLVAEADKFQLTFANPTIVNTTTTTAQIMCNATTIDFDITYPAIENVNTAITNDAVLTLTPAIPENAVIDWSVVINGSTVTGTQYKVVSADNAITTGKTVIRLSKITNTPSPYNQLVQHNAKVHNWQFTVSGNGTPTVDINKSYDLDISNVAVLNAKDYEFNNSDVDIQGLPMDITLTAISDIATITKTPIIITSGTTYPTMTGIAENVLVDEKITTQYSGGFPAGMKVTKVVYHNATTVNTVSTDVDYSLVGKSVVYLSDILGGTAVPLMSESGETITFDLYVEGATAATTGAIPVTVQTVAYVTKPVLNPVSGCETAIGSAEPFSVTYAPATFAVTETVKTVCGEDALKFSTVMSYPVITNLGADVKADARITVKTGSQFPKDAEIKWAGGGVPAQTYVLPAATNTIMLSTLVNAWANPDIAPTLLAGHSTKQNDTWTFEITKAGAEARTITIEPVAVLGSNVYAYDSKDITLTVNPLPTITLTATKTTDATYNATASSVVDLAFTGTDNGADTYTIDFNDAANTAGLVDVSTPTTLPTSPIKITVPVGVVVGTYTGTLKVQNSTTDCESQAYAFTLDVKKANQATITNSTATAIYGDADFSYAIAGGSGTGAVTYTSSNEAVATISSSGLVTIKAAGETDLSVTKAADANYNSATSGANKLTVNKKSINVTITASDKVYDGNSSTTATASSSELLANDVVTFTAGPIAFDNKNVGSTKTVTASVGITGGAAANNYSVAHTPVTTTAAITAKELTVTADNKSRCKGVDNPTFTLSYSGFISGEGPEVASGISKADGFTAPTASSANASADAGSYDITLTGGAATNYSFKYVKGTLTVTPPSVGGTITGGTSPLLTGASTGTMTLSGHTGIVSKWQRKVGAGEWQEVTASTVSPITTYNTDKTTLTQELTSAGIYTYRAEVKSGECSVAYSSERVINVSSEKAILTLASTVGTATKLTTIPVTATFSKSVSGFTTEDIAINNGSAVATVSGFSGSGTSYSFNVIPASNYEGNIVINVAASTENDAANLTIMRETTAPTVASIFEETNWSKTSHTVTITGDDAGTNVSGLDKLYYVYATTQTDPNLTSSSVDFSTKSAELTFSNEGIYILSCMATDKAGNTSSILSKTINIDKTVPTVLDNIPATTQNSNVEITFYPSDNLSGIAAVKYQIGSGTVQTLTNTYSFNSSTLPQGLSTIKFYAVDKAGNEGTTIEKTFTQNTAGPGSCSAILNGGNVINSANKASVSFAVKANPADASASLYWEIYNSTNENMKLNGTIAELTSLPHDAPGTGNDITYTLSNIDLSALQDGDLVLRVKLTGTNGIVGNFVTAASVAKDVVAPIVTITRITPSPTTLANVEFTATFSEAVTGTINNAIFSTSGVGTIGTVTNVGNVYTIPVNGLVSGNIATLTMTKAGINDAAGNALSDPIYTNNTITNAPVFVINTMVAQSDEGTKASIVYFGVTFSGHISNLRTSYFGVLTGDGTAFEAPATPSVVSLNTSDNITWTVGVSGMNRTGTVTLTMNNGACSSTAGIPLTGGNKINNSRYESTTSANYDLTNPEIASHTPNNPAPSAPVATNTSLTITFNENIVKNTDVGYIELYDRATDQVVQTIDVRSSYVSVANNVVTIATVNNLLPGAKDISVIIDGACFKDAAGNFFAGQTYAANEEYFFFTTSLDAPAPVSNLTYVTKTARTIRFTYRLPAGANALVLVKTSNSSSVVVPEINNDFTNPALTTGFADPIFNGEFTATAPSILTGIDNTNKSFTVSTSELTPSLTSGQSRVVTGDYKAVYNGTATDITVSGLSASKYYRIYVLTYNTNATSTNYVFNRTLPTSGNTSISQKTNAFKIGAEDDENSVEINGNFNVSDVTPNPVNDEINFKVDSYEGSDFSFTVFNMAGQELYTTMQLLNKGMNQVTIPVEKLGFVSSGSYMIRVSDASGETIVPFVINR